MTVTTNNSICQRDVSAIQPFQKKTHEGSGKRLKLIQSLQYLATYLKDIGADPGVHYTKSVIIK